MKENIALVGFMGTGKTAVARVLSERLGKKHVELDGLIEGMKEKTVSEIFAEEGEEGFRMAEKKAVKEASLMENAVISCGGGAVLDSENLKNLKKSAVIVLLYASTDEILKRTAGDDERPLLRGGDRRVRIDKLMEKRRPLYEKASDIAVDTTKLAPGEVADEIIKKLGDSGIQVR